MGRMTKRKSKEKSHTPLIDRDEKREVGYIAKEKGLPYNVVLRAYREGIEVHPFRESSDRIKFTEKLLHYQEITGRKLQKTPYIPRAPYKVRIQPDANGALDITVYPPEEDNYDDIRSTLESMRDTESTTVLQMPRTPEERAKQLEYIMQNLTPEQLKDLAKSLKTAKGHEGFSKFIAGCSKKLK